MTNVFRVLMICSFFVMGAGALYGGCSDDTFDEGTPDGDSDTDSDSDSDTDADTDTDSDSDSDTDADSDSDTGYENNWSCLICG